MDAALGAYLDGRVSYDETKTALRRRKSRFTRIGSRISWAVDPPIGGDTD